MRSELLLFPFQISYVRKVGSNEILKADDQKNAQKSKMEALKGMIFTLLWVYIQLQRSAKKSSNLYELLDFLLLFF